MKKHRPALFAFCWLLLTQQAGAGTLEAYQAGSWSTMRAAHAGRPWIVHLWGMSCEPCRAELSAWSRFQRQHPQAPLTFIEAEQANPVDIAQVLKQSALGGEQWFSPEGLSDTARYEISRHWFGELPLTLLISADGSMQTRVGGMDFRQMEDWLKRQK